MNCWLIPCKLATTIFAPTPGPLFSRHVCHWTRAESSGKPFVPGSSHQAMAAGDMEEKLSNFLQIFEHSGAFKVEGEWARAVARGSMRPGWKGEINSPKPSKCLWSKTELLVWKLAIIYVLQLRVRSLFDGHRKFGNGANEFPREKHNRHA